MSSPLVSVVIPTYNQPVLLFETLNSVFAQTLTDHEIIVVNDGSTDDTAERLSRLKDRLRVITQRNAGIGAARNRGIAEARGKYVAMLDHDDLWQPEKLATQVAYYEKTPECSIVSVPWALSGSPEDCVFNVVTTRDQRGLVDHPLRRLARGELFLITSAIMFRRDRAAGARYATARPCFEDHPFQMTLYTRGPVGIAGNGVLMIYRQHAQNTSKEAFYWYRGQTVLRALDRAGRLDALPEARRDLAELLGMFGRSAAVQQLGAGKRWRAAELYQREFPHQWRLGRLKFLATFPLLVLAPTRLIHRNWAGLAR